MISAESPRDAWRIASTRLDQLDFLDESVMRFLVIEPTEADADALQAAHERAEALLAEHTGPDDFRDPYMESDMT